MITEIKRKCLTAFSSFDKYNNKMVTDEIDIEEPDDHQKIKSETLPHFKDNFKEFSSKTGIYGLKYLYDPKGTPAERCFWLFFILVSSSICLTLIIKSWTLNQAPVLSHFSQSPKPIWQVPFPAITICPESKILQRMYNFTDKYHKYLYYKTYGIDTMTPYEIQTYSDVSLLCDNHLHTTEDKVTSNKVVEHFVNVSPSISEIFINCKNLIRNVSCSDLFSPILTDSGICFTSNMLNRKELFTEDSFFYKSKYFENNKVSKGWTLDEGYPKTSPRDTYPRRALSSGSKAGMYLLLKDHTSDLDYICRGPVQGFRILFHHPAEEPQVEKHYHRAPFNQEIIFRVSPDLTTTSKTLKKYDPHLRKCYFSHERNLKFFQSYTYENCKLECLANHTLNSCGCVSYYMPRTKTTPLCGSGSNVCVVEAEQHLLSSQIDSEITHFNSGNEDSSTSRCDCLPSCTSLKYKAEISHADFNWTQVLKAFKTDTRGFSGFHMTRITILFKDDHFMASERSDLGANKINLLVACGGLFGLFTGFSLFSVIEIVYFFFVRLMCDQYKRRFLTKSTNLINE